MSGWVEKDSSRSQTQGHCNNKEKISSPTYVLQEEKGRGWCVRGGKGVSMTKREGRKNEANLGGYSMYTQRHLMFIIYI